MTPTSPLLRTAAFLAIVLATMLNFAATDLVLPAIPSLPQLLRGTPEQAQHVLAAYVAGFAAGLLLWGELGARLPQRAVLVAALLLFAAASWGAGSADSLPALIAWRFVQGLTGAAGPAFAPGLIRRVFEGPRAMRAIGLQGSIESLMPALAPIAGAWLLAIGSWRTSFQLLAALSAGIGLLFVLLPGTVFPSPGGARRGSYLQVLRNREVSRHGLSQALTLAGLLVFVLGAPAVMVSVWGGPLSDFIRMQVVGVATFIACVQLSHRLCRRWGDEAVIVAGSLVSAAGCCAILLYALAGGRSAATVTVLWIAVNGGLGLRGPPGFMRAITAAGGDDSRAAAMVILAILGFTAAGTILVAPWITRGLLPVALASAALSTGSLAVLAALRPGGARRAV